MIRRALVTGAGAPGGIGFACARALARAGHRVAITATTGRIHARAAELIAEGHDVTAHIADLTEPAQVDRLADAVGAVDILVNNVGTPVPGGPVQLSEADWRRQIDINLSTVFLTCKQVIPVMQAQGGGAIVNIASTSGQRFTGAAQVGYASAKAGVIQFARVVAVEHAKDGIRINTVVPGQLHTPLVDAILAGNQSAGDVDMLLKRRQSRIPLPFMGDGRDTANAALFLASDEARFITGTEIVVDGGMSVRCD